MKMTYEEAKDIIECTAVENCDLCTTNVKNGGDCDCQKEFYMAIKLTIEAIENQILKKPKNITFDDGYLEFWNCPNCHFQHDSIQAYCEYCGQAIDWSIDNETPTI